jgi:GNAT superfamily N-acetyltransferase
VKPSASGPPAAQKPQLTIRPLTSEDWPNIVKLFGPNGACGGCWCMWWRVPMGGKTWHAAKGRKNRDRFRRAIQGGEVHGVLAFAGEEPVGWCCFGPRQTFPRLKRVKGLERGTRDDVWSIVCFYIPAKWRGRGVATRLLEAATAEAFARGAREIEGYPIVPRQERVPAVFAWTGVPALFEKTGYRELPHPDATRPIYTKRPAGKRGPTT